MLTKAWISIANSAERSRNAKSGSRTTTLICIRGCTRKVHLAFQNWTHFVSDKLPSDALNANLSSLSVEAQKRAKKDAAKKEAKAVAVEQRESERKASAKVLIKRVHRNKSKYVTVVSGLEEHDLDLKKIAKELGKKFATGSSVTKTASGGEEITVQGDVSDDLYDWLCENHEEIPEDNIDCIEDKKKKGGG
jgi:density-regulated protein DRP1